MLPSRVLSELQATVQFTVNEIKLIKELCETFELFDEATDNCKHCRVFFLSVHVCEFAKPDGLWKKNCFTVWH